MPETEDLYEILQLHPSAHPDVIRMAYLSLSVQYHPGQNPTPEAAKMLAALNRAYAVLSDPAKRAEYDRNRAAPAGSAAGQYQDASQNPTGYITLGATKSEVEAIHGPPHTVSAVEQNKAEIWHYHNDDSVEFGMDTERVQGWNNRQNNLSICLIPVTRVNDYDYLFDGDHRDEIVRLQGTPRLIEARRYADRELWEYSDNDSVEFISSTGRVISWTNDGNTLKITQETRNVQDNVYKNISFHAVDTTNPNRRLIVGFVDGELEIYVVWGRGNRISQSRQAAVEHKIDQGSAWWRHTWLLDDAKTATFMPFQVRMETIRALLYASEFTVRVRTFGRRPVTASFQITGFHKPLNFVLDAWRQAGSPDPARRTIQSRGGCILLPIAAIGAAAIAAPAIWLFL